MGGKKGKVSNSLLLVFFPHHHLHHRHLHLHLPTSFRRLFPSFSLLFLLLLLLFFITPQPPSTSTSLLFLRWGSLLTDTGNKGASGFLVVKSPPSFALQGLGFLHRRGTRSMPNLIVVHVPEDSTDDGLRVFLRALHRSGITVRSDVVLLLPDGSSSDDLYRVIRQENDAFLRLLDRHGNHRGNLTAAQKKMSAGNFLSFGSARFVRTSRRYKDAGEPPWGKRRKSDSARVNGRWSYGSVVSFKAGELDPERLLYGFLDHVQISLRRWSCYPILLGRLRRNFKHVMLVDAKDWIIVNDLFVRMQNQTSETVMLWVTDNPGNGKNNRRRRREFREQLPESKRLNAGILVGGMRGVRKMAEAMQTGIVTMTMGMQQLQGGRRKGGERTAGAAAAVTETRVMSQLVGKEMVRKNIDLKVEEDDVAATLGLTRNGNNSSNRDNNNKTFLLRVENNEYQEIRRLICSSDGSETHRDCKW